MSKFLQNFDTHGGQFLCCHLCPSRSQSFVPAPMPGIAEISYVSTHPNVAAGQGKQGGQWAEFLWGLVIGLQLSLASYVFGEQCALIVDRYLVPGGRDDTDLEGIEKRCAGSLAIWLRMLCRAFLLNIQHCAAGCMQICTMPGVGEVVKLLRIRIAAGSGDSKVSEAGRLTSRGMNYTTCAAQISVKLGER